MTFDKFSFSEKQIKTYYNSAVRDFKIAKNSDIPEVSFRFGYDALIKLAITICAKKGLKIKSRQGHRIELITKLSEFLKNKEIEILGNEMRTKRNRDLYDGGTLITTKQSKDYVNWIASVFEQIEKYLNLNNLKLNL